MPGVASGRPNGRPGPSLGRVPDRLTDPGDEIGADDLAMWQDQAPTGRSWRSIGGSGLSAAQSADATAT